MSEKRIQATARVQITLEVTANGTWGPECALDQVYKQGVDSAIGYLNKVLQADMQSGKIHVIGTPKITALLVENER